MKWGGGDNVRYKIANDPLHFFSVGGTAGTGITSLAVTSARCRRASVQAGGRG
jgi:hypothetical protein